MALFSPDQQFKEEPLNLWWWFQYSIQITSDVFAEITTVPGYDTHSMILWFVKTGHTWEYHVNECHWCIWKCNVSSFDDLDKIFYSFHPFPPDALNQTLFFTEAKQPANLFLCHRFSKRDLFTESLTALSLPLLQLLSEKVGEAWGNKPHI